MDCHKFDVTGSENLAKTTKKTDMKSVNRSLLTMLTHAPTITVAIVKAHKIYHTTAIFKFLQCLINERTT